MVGMRANPIGKIIFTAALSVLLILGTSSCSSEKKKIFKIGITQIATHTGIDLVRQGFLEGMKEQGYIDGKNVTYDIQNAQGQMPVAQTIAQKFVNDKVDLIFAITTPSTQAVAKAAQGTNIPIVFGAITDPISAGLVKSLENPGGNITGTSDVWPVKEQFELLLRLVPSVKKVGAVFNPGESNAKYNMEMVDQAARELGLKIIKVPVSSSSEVQQAAQSLVRRCDAMYLPASNTVGEAINALVKVSESNKIPLLAGDAASVEHGGFGTLGNDYYDIGRQSARLADEIIKGKKPSEIPVARSTKYEYFFNLRSAKATGVKIPEALLNKAAKVYK